MFVLNFHFNYFILNLSILHVFSLLNVFTRTVHTRIQHIKLIVFICQFFFCHNFHVIPILTFLRSFVWNVEFVIHIILVMLFLKLFVRIPIATSHFTMPVCMKLVLLIKYVFLNVFLFLDSVRLNFILQFYRLWII